MAEIKIEKKKSAWPWIIAILLILGLVYFLLSRQKKEVAVTEAVQPTTVDTAQETATDYVTVYMHFLEAGGKMDLSHGYSHDALTKLADAVNQKANQYGIDASSDMDRVRKQADHLMVDELETTHADSIKAAAAILSKVLQNIQQVNFPNLENEMKEVTSAAKAIKPKKLTLDQKEAVKTYFERTGQLLKSMN